MSISDRLRNFVEQWRHCYLLLGAAFAVVWRTSALPLPILQNTRIGGGLHPTDVFGLMVMLKIMWILPLGAAVLYVASFAIRQLNTASAIAVSALCSIPVLALTLVMALIHICVQ
jgi:hypothetical protein